MNTTQQIEIIVTAKPQVVQVEGFEPHFSGSPRQKAWAVEIAKTAMRQFAALSATEVQKSQRLGWSAADIEIIKEHVRNAVASAVKATEHRTYAGWWINNRSDGPALFKNAWK